MGQISKATIKRMKSWYNPLFLNFNGVIYEVKKFVFYNSLDGKVIGENDRGWFCETPSLESMEYSEMEIRNKVDLTIKHPFFVRTKDELSIVKSSMAVVYIPATVVSVSFEQPKGPFGISYKYRLTDVEMCGGYKARVREFVESITTAAYDKREAIAKKCGTDSFTLNGILKVLRDEGYGVDDIISD